MNSRADTDYPKLIIVLVYAMLFCYYVRPQDNIPGMNAIPWVGVLFLIVNIWGITKVSGEIFKTPVIWVFWVGCWFVLTGIGAEVVVSYKFAITWIFQRLPMCIAIYLVFTSSNRHKGFLKLWLIIYFFLALATFKNAPRGAGDFTWDPNDAALALSMGLPFALYYKDLPWISKKYQRFAIFTALLIVGAIIMTKSRGGFLGLVAVSLTIWWLSKSRIKSAFYGILAALVFGAALINFLPEGYIDEVKSIGDSEEGTRVERLHTWEVSWVMFKHHPIMGVGGGNFPHNVHKYQTKTSWYTGNEKSLSGRVAHSLYFTILPELGIIGVLLYGYLIFYVPLKLLRIRSKFDGDSEEHQFIRAFSKMLIVAMAGYATAGVFISVAYYPHLPIWATMYAILLHYIKQTEKTEQAQSSAEKQTA